MHKNIGEGSTQHCRRLTAYVKLHGERVLFYQGIAMNTRRDTFANNKQHILLVNSHLFLLECKNIYDQEGT